MNESVRRIHDYNLAVRRHPHAAKLLRAQWLTDKVPVLDSGNFGLERDLAITSEMLAIFARFFFMITPPMPQAEQAAARALGLLRFEQMVEEVSSRLRTDASWIAQIKMRLGETEQKT